MGPAAGSPRSERNRICHALIELVAEREYRSISLDQVLQRAAVNRAAFARHFESLEDCFAAAWDEIDSELSRRMREAFESSEQWEDGLREALSAGLRFLAAEEGSARLYVDEAIFLNDELRERQRVALARLSSLIDRGRTAPDANNRVPREVAEAVSGAIWHRVQQLLRAGRGSDLPAQVSPLMFFAVLPYRGAAAAEAELRRPFSR